MADTDRPQARGRGAPSPSRWTAVSSRLRQAVAAAAAFVLAHWVWVAGVASLCGFLALWAWSQQLPNAAGGGAECARQSLDYRADATQTCGAQLRAIVAAAAPNGERTCAPAGKNDDVLCAFDEAGAPRLFVWADNVLVDLYTLFFIGSLAASYKRLRRPTQEPSMPRRVLFVSSVALCLAGALVDHAENFWLLAHIGQHLSQAADDVDLVASLSLWKFRLAVLNLGLVLAWLAWASYRHIVPYPFMHPWPRFLWDARSRRFFAPDTVTIDPFNAAQAYPLYPRELLSLSGAPRDSTVSCTRDAQTLQLTVESAMLEEPLVVQVLFDTALNRPQSASLTFPRVKPAFRGKGLAARMVLNASRAARELGLARLESSGPLVDGEFNPKKSLRGTQMALALGWDAALPEEAFATLPPGLRHVRSLQELVSYRDGKAWWSSAPLSLPLQFDLSDASTCLARLQSFATLRGIRLSQ